MKIDVIATKFQKHSVNQIKMRNIVGAEDLSEKVPTGETDYIPSMYEVEDNHDWNNGNAPSVFMTNSEMRHSVLLSMLHNSKERYPKKQRQA